jgi:CubicO group peptidase (beta-lactamase class C family)
VVTLALLAVVPGDWPGSSRQPSAPAFSFPASWQVSAPEEHGADSAKLADGLLTIREDEARIHSLLIIRNDSVVLDAYFYPYDGKTVHDLASVTKSILTTLIGIAADQGKLNLDQPVVSFFPERTIANRDTLKERITVRHLAGMASGLDCTPEGSEATLREMRATPDWVQFVLDRRVVSEPGTAFVYCSPGSHLLAAVLQRSTGMTALDFARQYLFQPLGIQEVLWPADAQGYNHGWGDMYLHPRDLARIGYLWLNKGEWEGKQIVSREWVEASVKPWLKADEDDYYGYGWWVGAVSGPWEYSAEGSGGQTIMVYPDLNSIVVTTGGGFRYDQAEEVIVAAIVDSDKPLPANPAGVARLNEALVAIMQARDAPKPVPPLPAMAKAISGKTYVFEPNPSGLQTLRLEFNESSEAQFTLTLTEGEETLSGPVGLDGVYHISPGPNNLPEAYRGNWTDERTFVVDYDQIANRDAFMIRIRFEGEASERVIVEAYPRAGGSAVRAKGTAQNP